MAVAAKGRQLLGLDLVRFSAAFLVMTFHIGGGVGGPVGCGWVGVEIFFVLSGFVIAYSAAEARAGGFLKSRFVRLMPTVWLCGSLTAAVWMMRGAPPDLPNRYFATMTLWPQGPWVDGSYWTLPVEIAFYATVFALLVVRGFRRCEWLFAALIAASCLFWLGRLGLQFRPHAGWLAWVNALPNVWPVEPLLYHGCYFGLGGILWLVWRSGWTRVRALLALVAVAGGMIQIAFAARAFSATQSLAPPELVWLAALGAVWLSARYAAPLALRLAPFAGAIRLIGLTTYPLYLLHDDMGSDLRDALGHWMPRPLAMTITGVAFVALAMAVAQWIEPPLQRWVRAGLARAGALIPRPRAAPIADPAAAETDTPPAAA